MMSETLLESQLGRSIVSEWEDNVLFDADDPDFASSSNVAGNNGNRSSAMLQAILKKGEFAKIASIGPGSSLYSILWVSL